MTLMNLTREIEKYDIYEDLDNTKANVVFPQFLELSNQNRSNLTKGLKKERVDISIVMDLVQQGELKT